MCSHDGTKGVIETETGIETGTKTGTIFFARACQERNQTKTAIETETGFETGTPYLKKNGKSCPEPELKSSLN